MNALRYEVISNQILKKLYDEHRISIEHHEIYTYAIEKLLAGLVNALLLLLVSLIFRIVGEMIVFVTFYLPIRKYAGGIHARTRTKCVALSLLSMVLLVKAGNVIILGDLWKIISLIIVSSVILLVYLYAPIDTENKRLSPESRIRLARIAKCFTLAESSILVLGILFVPVMKEYIVTAAMALLLAGIALIPYKQFKGGFEL